MATQAAKDPSQDEEFLSQLYKGGELLAAGKVVEAKDHLERAFKLHPKNEKAQNLLGLTYFKLGLFDRAAEIYELLVRENPADPTLRVNLGLVYLKTNNLPRAVKEFETSTDLEPGHKKAHNYLGLALAQSGDYTRAREHFQIAGSDAMAEKMERAISAGAVAPVAVTPQPPPSAPLPPVSSIHAGVSEPPPLPIISAAAEEIPVESLGPPPLIDESPLEVMSEDVMTDDEVPEGSEIVPAESLLKPKAPSTAVVPLPGPTPSNGATQSSAVALAEAAQNLGGANKPPLPPAGFEDVPPPMPSPSKALLNDWGAQFGMDAAAPMPPNAQGTEDDMRFAEDEGPSAMPMPTLGNGQELLATSEAAVATGAQVPVEVVERAQASETWEEGMPVVEATAEEVMVEIETDPTPMEARASDMGLSAAADQAESPPPEPSEIPPGLNYSSDAPSAASDDVPLADAIGDTGELPADSSAYEASPGDVALADAISDGAPVEAAPVEMFPSGGSDDAYATQEAWPTSDGAPPEAASPDWLTGGATQQEPQEQQGSYEEAPTGESQVPITAQVPTAATDMAMPAVAQSGYSPMAAPRLEEIGPSQALNFATGEMNGPFNLSQDGLALSVNGELLSRMPGLMAVVGTIDAAPEFRRSRGRMTDQPFGQGELQLQRVRGNGMIHLDPQGAVYQAIDLADEGAYIREERVFAFEEAVAFENARLTGQGGIGVDVVHLKGQGKVLLKLEGALKAMAIPPGTPLKIPLARLVGWYGYVSVRVMGFVGQGAVELTGDGYVLLAA